MQRVLDKEKGVIRSNQFYKKMNTKDSCKNHGHHARGSS